MNYIYTPVQLVAVMHDQAVRQQPSGAHTQPEGETAGRGKTACMSFTATIVTCNQKKRMDFKYI